jgi:hypothetical protein
VKLCALGRFAILVLAVCLLSLADVRANLPSNHSVEPLAGKHATGNVLDLVAFVLSGLCRFENDGECTLLD